MILIWISAVLCLAYALLIATSTAGWWRLKEFKSGSSTATVKISVVIAVRNEEANIAALLGSILSQDYQHDLFEIIISDDHSTDSTSLQVEKYISQEKDIPFLKLIPAFAGEATGKKNALARGILQSNGELIVITDADCTAGVSWLSELAAFYAHHRPQMILGPVRMTDGGSIFGKLQALEFVSLISTAAGSCNAGFPLLANGANIAFSRQAFERCGGFAGHMQYVSGDDMFLMMRMRKIYGSRAIRFIKSRKAIVNTPAIQQYKPFVQQRLRWVSKSRGYTDGIIISTSLLVFLVNSWMVMLAARALFSPDIWKLVLVVYAVKTLVDLPVMISYSRFQQSGRLLWFFPVMEILNAFYTFCIGIAGNLRKYEWKGRIFSSVK
jgi:cellulose synthase/poly-beta-1,6-N-acetylglucosamine synthase-like glycosyltransferase